MNRRKFWGVFAAMQLLGSLGLATGSPHGNPYSLIAATVLLLPGSVAGVVILDRMGIQFGYVSLLVSAMTVNLVSWYVVALAVTMLRDKKVTRSSSR